MREIEALDKDRPYNGLAQLIAAEQLGQKISAEERAQVYRKLRRDYVWELKILLAPDLWRYLDPITDPHANSVPRERTQTTQMTERTPESRGH